MCFSPSFGCHMGAVGASTKEAVQACAATRALCRKSTPMPLRPDAKTCGPVAQLSPTTKQVSPTALLETLLLNDSCLPHTFWAMQKSYEEEKPSQDSYGTVTHHLPKAKVLMQKQDCCQPCVLRSSSDPGCRPTHAHTRCMTMLVAN